MIISAFPFLNELDLLEYRLRTMAPFVDMFVLMESPVTFSGKPKPLYYAENKERFKQWNIHHFVVEEREGDKLWDREQYQRRCLVEEVARLRPEIVIFSDCDEFVQPDVVQRFLESGHDMMRLEMDMLTFFLDRKDSIEWVQGCICKWKEGLEPEFRGGSSPVLAKAGWHFEFFGSRELLLEKVEAISHGPEAGGRDFHKRVKNGEFPGLERTSSYPVENLPQPMRDDITLLTQKGWVYNRFLAAPKGKTERSAFTIVFNGDFTLEQCIENAMPVLDRYVVVEGAVENMLPLSSSGASTDRTNEILTRLEKKYAGKLVVVHGLWKDKLTMCSEALKHLQPGLLWELDADEFYHTDAMFRMMNFMDRNLEYTDAEFWGYHFFGGFTHHTQMRPGYWGNDPAWRRLFRWNGEPWKSHIPPRLDHEEMVLTRDDTVELDVMLYHYGYCWHRQVVEKAMYHRSPFQYQQLAEFEKQWLGDVQKTSEDFEGKRPSLVEFTGQHPVNVKEFVC